MLSHAALRPFSTLALTRINVSASEFAGGVLSSLQVMVPGCSTSMGPAGYAHLLSKYAFLNTLHKSALRFTRELELLGGVFSATPTRDALVLSATFMKKDLPYYVEALGHVCVNTAFRPHELEEIVLPACKAEYNSAHASNQFTAIEEAHAISFGRGVGQPLYYNGVAPVSSEDVANFARAGFNSSSLTISASGTNESDLQLFVNESAFSSILGSENVVSVPVATFKGQQSRISTTGDNVAIIAVPVPVKQYEAYERLAVAAGSLIVPCSEAPLSSIQGALAQLYKYKDVGLFLVLVRGSADHVARGISLAKRAVEQCASSSLEKYAKNAALAVALLQGPVMPASNAKPSIADFNYVAVGNLDVLPFAGEL